MGTPDSVPATERQAAVPSPSDQPPAASSAAARPAVPSPRAPDDAPPSSAAGSSASLGEQLRAHQAGTTTLGPLPTVRPAVPSPTVPKQRDPVPVPDDIGGALESLGEQHPAAAQLLCLCSVLHAAPVPVDVFTRSLDRMPRPLGGVAPLQFSGLVAALVEPGLAHRGADGLRVPAPVRAAVRDDLGDEAAGVCRAYAGVLVGAAVPDDVAAPSTWPRWAALAPHLVAADAAHSADPALRAAACRLVVSLLHRGKARPARTIAAQLHDGWLETLGADHPDTLRCAHELARSLVAAGALLPARKLLDDTVDRLVSVLGQSHPQTRVAAETRRGVLLRMGGMPRADGSRGKAAHRRRKQP
ncbi:tetratricopeptide repeat protein [Actinoplanes solisilvae]|uniref:tetratricopeptide repeat protein n=1 Tax=Actinoplanes solisilvae TaxID=2486853 RepID=UPI000FDC04F7|nr:tetratricopeptide repeat protein [Actinoplanes solisilvae]